MNFYSGKYKKAELFIRKEGKQNGEFLLKIKEQQVVKTEIACDIFHKVTVELCENTEYQMLWTNSVISQMYLCGNEDIAETGIKYLIVNNEQPESAEVFDTPWREQFHFTPYVNWNNDPNGLCWFQGRYHLYYQANPHVQKWDNIYWGHAVSKDLIHWTYLPYALDPQPEILESEKLVGGAFSGSAVVLPDGLRIFFTRDLEERGKPETIRQSQATAFSRDGLVFSEEQEILPAYAVQGIDMNFRDPKVFWDNGKWYMVLATNYFGKGSILLFSSEDMLRWNFIKPLLQEENPEIPSMECPDFFPLGNDTWVLLASVMGIRTKYGVYQPVMYYIGDWKDEKFTVHKREVCDFGCNFYAPQTFEHDGRRIMIAWICDWEGEQIITRHGTYGGVTLPRELSVREGRLYQRPVEEVYRLQKELLFWQNSGKAVSVEVPGNSYYSCIEFCGRTEFEIALFDDGIDYLKIIGKNTMIELISSKNKDSQARFVAETEELRKLEIFMDRRTVELYLNDGEKVGTKIYMSPDRNGRITFQFAKETEVTHISIHRMEAIWTE